LNEHILQFYEIIVLNPCFLTMAFYASFELIRFLQRGVIKIMPCVLLEKLIF